MRIQTFSWTLMITLATLAQSGCGSDGKGASGETVETRIAAQASRNAEYRETMPSAESCREAGGEWVEGTGCRVTEKICAVFGTWSAGHGCKLGGKAATEEGCAAVIEAEWIEGDGCLLRYGSSSLMER